MATEITFKKCFAVLVAVFLIFSGCGDDGGTADQDSGSLTDGGDGAQADSGNPDAGFDAGLQIDAGADAGPDGSHPPDASLDSGTDGGTVEDTGSDSGYDAGFDAGTDAGSKGDSGTDASADSGIDSGSDAGFDSGFDAGLDAGYDAGQPDAGACFEVPTPEPVPDYTLPGESPAGRTESYTQGGFHDEYLYDKTDYIKIGVRREWGGSIIFFGLKSGGAGMNSTNTIDANDTGREVQVAFYDPDRIMQNCAWNASCGTTPTQCQSSITFLGWDPVQGGNRCNNGSGVDSVGTSGGTLAVVTTPLFWNPDWDRTDCDSSGCSDPVKKYRRGDVRVTQKMRFVRTHVAELDYTVENLADLAHAETMQEMPTLYSANGKQGPDLWKLMDSQGNQVPIDQPAGGDGFYYKNMTSPGGWVSMQNEALNYGVGIYYENRLPDFQGWQLRSLPFNNVRARFPFAIPARGVVRARAYLILGAYSTIQGEAGAIDTALAPFGVLDGPAADATISGKVSIGGWALDNKGVTSVSILIDGTTSIPLTYGNSRPDVCLVWPKYPGCPNVGYTGLLDTSILTPCAHLLEIVAKDGDSNARVIARQRVIVVR